MHLHTLHASSNCAREFDVRVNTALWRHLSPHHHIIFTLILRCGLNTTFRERAPNDQESELRVILSKQ